MGSVQFTKLKKDSKIEVLWQACQQRIDFKVWKKGETNRLELKAVKLDESELSILVHSHEVDFESFRNHDLLVNFVHFGVHYFGNVKLISDVSESKFLLDFKTDLFRCERRGNFRVSLYGKENNLFEVYKYSLPENPGVMLREYFEKNKREQFKVINVSGNGVAVIAPKHWNALIKVKEIYKHTMLKIDGLRFEIEEAELVYSEDAGFLYDDEKGKLKIAFSFLKIDKSTEKELVKLLTGELGESSYDQDFEAFLK